MKINVIIAAGGSSVRYGKNKLFEPLASSNIIMETIKKFVYHEQISRIVVAIKSENVDEMLQFQDFYNIDTSNKKIRYAQNGSTRTESIANALQTVEEDCDIILVHDGARPFVSHELIENIIDATKKNGSAIPCTDLIDSIINISATPKSQCRSNFKCVQTPQGFDAKKLKLAYQKREHNNFTDDFSLFETYFGSETEIVEGDKINIKITLPSDMKTTLCGTGYDIHRYQQGDGLVVGGIKIPFDKSFVAHSDGDVVLHATMDAILSALGEKDIGHLFPVDDDNFKDANSQDLLKVVIEKLDSKNLHVGNVSISIIAEQPKISPHVDKIRESIAKMFDIAKEKVGLTATTNEEVGELGSGNSMASIVSVLISN